MSGPDAARQPVVPGRRVVLRAGVIGFAVASGGMLAAVTGCSAGGTTRPGAAQRRSSAQAQRDAAAVTRAVQTSRSLRSGAQAAGDAEVAADHGAHLTALGASPDGGPTAAIPVGDQAGAELDGAMQALADVRGTSPEVAVLLTRIAASRAAHADRLGGAGSAAPRAEQPDGSAASATPSPSGPAGTADVAAAREALARLVADAHAAVFGYGVVTARVADADREQAERYWQEHRRLREEAVEAMIALDGRAPAALAAYDVGALDDAQAVRDLAARIDAAMTTRLLTTLAQVDGTLRSVFAADAVAAVRRVQAWGGTVAALPGGP